MSAVFSPINDQLNTFNTTHFCYVNALHSNVLSNDALTSFKGFLFIHSEGSLKIVSSYCSTHHHTAIRNGKNLPLQHKPRGVLHTMAMAMLTATESMICT